MSARRDAPKPSFFRVCRYVICCNANATLFSTICDSQVLYARAFTFFFLVMKRNAETSKPRRSAKAPTGASSRAPPPSAERDARAVARRSPPDSTRRGARVVRARVPRRSRRYPRCLDASQPERLGDQGERLLERRTTRARFKKNAASLLRGVFLVARLAEKRSHARERLGVRREERREDARSVPPGFRGSATRTTPRQREKERGGAPREFRGPFLRGRRGPRPRRAVRSGGNRRAPPKRDATVVGVFFCLRVFRLRLAFHRHTEIGQPSRAAVRLPGAHEAASPREVVPRDVSRLGGEARLRAV